MCTAHQISRNNNNGDSETFIFGWLELMNPFVFEPGIYVAVVLGVYLILLTMLLCRYAKRHRPSTDAASLLTAPPGIPPPTPQRSRGIFSCGSCHFTCHLTPAPFRTIYKSFLCCCRQSPSSMDESIHEISDYPMTALASQIECKEQRYGTKKNKPVPV